MKQYKALTAVLAVILITGLALTCFVMRRQNDRSTDIVLLNDIAVTAKEHIDSPDELAEFDFGVGFAVLDADGNTVYSSVPVSIGGIPDAIRKHYPYLNITDGDRLLGTAVILEDIGEAYEKQRKTAICAIAVTEIFIVLCIVIWGVYVKRSIVKPFGKMERFAADVAAGNLDMPLEMERDNMFGIFTESFDIMREELAASRDREIRLKQREKELIASLSHDLKTPITGIKLTAELMQAQTSDPASAEKLGNIYRKAEQIDALVSDLLTSTLKDLGEMKVALTDENSAVLHEFVRRCDDRELAEETPIPDCIISIDSRRMEQIVWNILSNSYKYAGTPISIGYEIVDRFLKMSIRDYGSGVPEDELLLLTNKFYRSRSSAESGTEGSGLGLYIVKTLIEKMNGDMRCLNADPGFEVWLFIPLA